MREMTFADAIDDSIRQSMIENDDVMVIGEDVHSLCNALFTQFGSKRIISTPISEAGFVGASVSAAMADLRPVVEVMLIDFIGVVMDAILNHASKTYTFSGEAWNVPIVVRGSCGGGYGDGGQHEQSLWGWLAHIPGLNILVPSNPNDAGALMYSAINYDHPVIFFEHKLLSSKWLDYLGIGGRDTVSFDVPQDGTIREFPDEWTSIKLDQSEVVREGSDITIASLVISLHKSLEAADTLAQQDIFPEVIDLRSVSPLDTKQLKKSISKTGSLVVVDEDYSEFGLSGEICAKLLENGLSFSFGRVGTDKTIPHARNLEEMVLPNIERIVEIVETLLDN